MARTETAPTANAEQIALWNAEAGRGWVHRQESLDRLFAPFETLLVEAVAARKALRVLDVGCGTGSTTLAIARQIGSAGTVIGLDISEPMLAVARQRASHTRVPPRFLCADAQTHAFTPASFDLVVSRFGVMFFDDPVRAFANLRRAAADGGRLQVIVWRSAADNPFMTEAERAAAPFLPQLPPRKPGEPGQFRLGDRDRVQAILTSSSWTKIDIARLDVACTLPEAELDDYVTQLGPLARVLPQLDEPARKQLVATVRAAFERYVHGGEVRFTAACWMIGARA